MEVLGAKYLWIIRESPGKLHPVFILYPSCMDPLWYKVYDSV